MCFALASIALPSWLQELASGYYYRSAVHQQPPPTSLLLLSSFLPLPFQDPLIYDLQPQEMGFALRVEELLSDASQPEYRQLIVELLTVVAALVERNPEVTFVETIRLEEVSNAVIVGVSSHSILLFLSDFICVLCLH